MFVIVISGKFIHTERIPEQFISVVPKTILVRTNFPNLHKMNSFLIGFDCCIYLTSRWRTKTNAMVALSGLKFGDSQNVQPLVFFDFVLKTLARLDKIFQAYTASKGHKFWKHFWRISSTKLNLINCRQNQEII